MLLGRLAGCAFGRLLGLLIGSLAKYFKYSKVATPRHK